MPGAPLHPFIEPARDALATPAEIGKTLKEAERRAAHSASLMESVPSLCALVAAHANELYDDADEDDVILALAALMYVASDWDEMPDYLPHGLHDDEVVTRNVVDRIERTLREFEDWRNPPARRPRRRV
jgi:uncharacterized membrane protein YkvA (DUF1232 family)